MNKIDFTACPKCGDEDTGSMLDFVYEYGWSTRVCDGPNGCGASYKVEWEITPVKSYVLEK